jgi:hypothetical protein
MWLFIADYPGENRDSPLVLFGSSCQAAVTAFAALIYGNI